MCSSRVKPERRLRTRLVSQAILAGGLVSLGAALIVGTLAYSYLTRQMARKLTRVAQDLVEEYAAEQRGEPITKSFITHMNEDAEEHDSSRFFVMLVGSHGEIVHVTPTPKPIQQAMLVGACGLSVGHIQRTLVAMGRARRCALRRLATRLPDGKVIVVALDGTQHETFFFAILGVLGGSFLLITLLAGLSAFFFGTRLERRLATIASAAEAIAAGDWSRRVSAHGEVREVENLVRLFNLMCDRNERTLNELRVLTDNIAHDLRTPLTRLALAAESAAAEGGSTRPLADVVTEETASMLDMIDVMLEISRTDAKIDASPRVALDVGALVEETVALFRPLAAESGLKLDYAMPLEPIRYSGHRAKFQRLLGNLTENAIKYTPSGGRIVWSVTRPASGGVRLVISDTGCGIAADDIPHIFTRFWRADSSRHCPGNGLGLALVKAIATSYGGTVRCESTLGEGSSFTVTLPPSLSIEKSVL